MQDENELLRRNKAKTEEEFATAKAVSAILTTALIQGFIKAYSVAETAGPEFISTGFVPAVGTGISVGLTDLDSFAESKHGKNPGFFTRGIGVVYKVLQEVLEAHTEHHSRKW